jgi:hypothetical protein
MKVSVAAMLTKQSQNAYRDPDVLALGPVRTVK